MGTQRQAYRTRQAWLAQGSRLIRRGATAGALIALTLATSPSYGKEKAADLLIVNGHVYPAEGDARFEEAVAIRDGRILAVGSNNSLGALRDSHTRVIDAHGAAVTPGLIDTHVHFLMGAQTLDQIDVNSVRDSAELARRVAAFAKAHEDRPWLHGFGYFSDKLTAQDIDAGCADRPVVLRAGDGHSMLANSRALALAGITAKTPNPDGGIIVRDARGNPTGLLLETAQGLMAATMPEPGLADRMRLLDIATREALKAGITTIVNVGGTDDLTLLDQARAENRLGIRIYQSLWLTADSKSAELPLGFAFSRADADRFRAIRDAHKDDALLRTGMVKIMLDGVIESHTAALLAPYSDQPSNNGHANYTPEELTRVITMMDADGWQIMTHGLGDRAVRMALDAYEAAARANPAPTRGRRHKIEHVETIDPAEVPRFASLGVTASLQPDHAGGMNDPDQQGRRWTYLGYTRSAWGFPWKSIRQAGGRVAFGSDWPVAPLNIGPGMAVATGRLPHPPIPDQKLTVAEVIDGYTRDAAYSIFADKETGTLTPGKRADIVIFRDDIFAGQRQETIDVAYTLLNGAVVYSGEKDGNNERD